MLILMRINEKSVSAFILVIINQNISSEPLKARLAV